MWDTYYLDFAPILVCSAHTLFLPQTTSLVLHQGFSVPVFLLFVVLLHIALARPIPATNRTHEQLLKQIGRWIWRIVPTDRLNGLINILLHITFTLQFSSCCRGGWLRERSSFPSIKSKPYNQHFSSIISFSENSCFVRLLPRYFRNSLIAWLYVHHNLLRRIARRACTLRRDFSKMASR